MMKINKLENYIEKHTVSSSILLYFVGYLLIGSFIISLTPTKYQNIYSISCIFDSFLFND